MTKDEKLYKKFKDKFSLIFDDQYLSPLITNHFDKNGAFVGFIIGLLLNQIDYDRVFAHLQINKDEWSELFCLLYKDETIIEAHKKLEINPIIPMEQINQLFDCFNPFINSFIDFIKKHELNLNIRYEEIPSLIRAVYSYLLYNSIENKIAYHFKDILVDDDYETKYIFILNNTKLFAQAKKQITKCCKTKINDLIVLLLGMNKELNLNN